MSVEENLAKVKNTIKNGVTLVAVSKTHPSEVVMDAYNAGQRIFGENKVQEMCAKAEVMPKDIQWHLIGHLQSNKVKYIAPFVSMIHSVDSMALLEKIDAAAIKADRVIDILLEVHVAQEDTKFGLSIEQARQIALSTEISQMKGIRLRGIMGMASNTDNMAQVKAEFLRLKVLFDTLKSTSQTIDTLSMGMSGDYMLAMECGSTMVRVGSSIFGHRDYSVH
ncbi:MAG: YggS family pyridoxal phosphate-dependent enzyme [Flavobacteriales bacterium]|nr:YggS family pyridoxal phosphate-dependent enzyme [Flavobacteriales bacterium]